MLDVGCWMLAARLPGPQPTSNIQHPTSAFSQFPQFLGRRRQDLASVFRDQNCVLDADTAESLQVRSRLDGYGHSLQEAGLLASSQAGWLMYLQPQAVAGGVNESLVQLFHLQAAPGLPIHMRCRHPGPYRVDGGLLGLQNRAVNPFDCCA